MTFRVSRKKSWLSHKKFSNSSKDNERNGSCSPKTPGVSRDRRRRARNAPSFFLRNGVRYLRQAVHLANFCGTFFSWNSCFMPFFGTSTVRGRGKLEHHDGVWRFWKLEKVARKPAPGIYRALPEGAEALQARPVWIGRQFAKLLDQRTRETALSCVIDLVIQTASATVHAR